MSARFLCLEDDLGNISGRCNKQCRECRDVQEHEQNAMPDDDGPSPYDLSANRGWRDLG